jgi:hypothetical protein
VSVDGLLSEGADIRDSGLPSLGTRRALFMFDNLRCVGGTQPASTAWQIDYVVDATMILIPSDEQVGVMREVGVAWRGMTSSSSVCCPRRHRSWRVP